MSVGGRAALGGKILTVVALALGTGLIVQSSPPVEPTAEIEPIAHVEPWELTHVAPDPVDPPTTAKPGVRGPSHVVSLQQVWEADGFRPAYECDDWNEPLTEQREALTILARWNLVRSDEARAVAELFDQEDPTSIHRAGVTHALP